MTDTLWLKFADDTSLPSFLTEPEKKKLESIFDAQNPDSLWSRAVEALGLREDRRAILKWHQHTPYINWSVMTAMVTANWIEVVSDKKIGYCYRLRGKIRDFLAFLKSQWRTSQYIMRVTSEDLPVGPDECIVESLALGFALLILSLRLPAHDEVQLAQWLSHPSKRKPSIRRTLDKIQDIQKRRTLLSSAWQIYFPRRDEEQHMELPPFFWDEPAASHKKEKIICAANIWKGLPVSGGVAVGSAILMTGKNLPESGTDSLILIFNQARPQTIEHFSNAAGVIYIQGGVMSHACTIAREQGICCVTAAGRGFADRIEDLVAQGRVWLSLDGATGEIKLIKQDGAPFEA